MTAVRRVAVGVASLLTLITIAGIAGALVLEWIAAAPHHDTEAERGFLCFIASCGFGVAAFFAWLIALDADAVFSDYLDDVEVDLRRKIEDRERSAS